MNSKECNYLEDYKCVFLAMPGSLLPAKSSVPEDAYIKQNCLIQRAETIMFENMQAHDLDNSASSRMPVELDYLFQCSGDAMLHFDMKWQLL